MAGERAVAAREQQWLGDNGRPDPAAAVRHAAELEGDGAGYDVASCELDGSPRYIEVKTTRGGAETDFYMSANEVEFSRRRADTYYLYRVFDFTPELGRGKYYVRHGSLAGSPSLQLDAVQYRARLVLEARTCILVIDRASEPASAAVSRTRTTRRAAAPPAPFPPPRWRSIG